MGLSIGSVGNTAALFPKDPAEASKAAGGAFVALGIGGMLGGGAFAAIAGQSLHAGAPAAAACLLGGGIAIAGLVAVASGAVNLAVGE